MIEDNYAYAIANILLSLINLARKRKNDPASPMMPYEKRCQKASGRHTRDWLTEKRMSLLKCSTVACLMNTPPIGVPANAPVDMNANIIPMRPPTFSIGDIVATHA
jgi:hypothetical protein